MRISWWAVLALLAGCPTIDNARYCDGNTACADPRFPICDLRRRECVAGAVVPDLAVADLGEPDLEVADLTVAAGDLAGDDAARDAGLSPDLPPAPCSGSASCPAATPICGGPMCRACSGAADHAECAVRSAGTPKCRLSGPNAGRCAECNLNDDCAASTPVCASEGTCRNCRTHRECASSVCDLAAGSCVGTGQIVYVNNITCTGTGSDNGSQPNPYCQIATAITNRSGKKYIAVAGSPTTYAGQVTLNESTEIVIVGPGRSAPLTARVHTDGANAFIVTTAGNGQTTTATLDGLFAVGDVGANWSAVICSTPNDPDAVNLTVRDSILDAGESGIRALNDCQVTALSNVFLRNNYGLDFQDTTRYTVTNNFITDNAIVGVRFAAGALGIGGFSFNTVAYNGTGATAGGLDCGATSRLVVGSIVANNTKTAGGTQLAGTCDLQTVVTGTDAIVSAGKISAPPAFALPIFDLHLNTSDSASLTANQACCIDKAGVPDAGAASLPPDDIDGLNTRPLGAAHDVGADEAL